VSVDIGTWAGTTSGARSDDVALELEAVLGESEGGGSGSFPGSASDKGRWYVKPQNNPQGGKVIVTEYLVSQVGALIGAPVCEVQPVAIPPTLAGYRFGSGLELAEGVASASKAVGDAVEDRALIHRDRDDNARRHAGVLALYDWCWGGDPQWLYVATAESRVYSHDHGWYLPPEGPDWTVEEMGAVAGQAHELAHASDGLDPEELDRLADALGAVDAAALKTILESVPSSWPVADEELDAVGWFLELRAPEVASRMRPLSAKLRGTP
jgi:hypothetical protein